MGMFLEVTSLGKRTPEGYRLFVLLVSPNGRGVVKEKDDDHLCGQPQEGGGGGGVF